ncbi:hypothetical protein JAO29_10140 [Edaphobacter sp. HDX4]|uniref:hypothetical protein n=1 Tax=Edaphobacter sp. HDX4 TaxID=2794064 RepID=UPI002FE67185
MRVPRQGPDLNAEDSEKSPAEDNQILTWEQLRAVLKAATRRDRILLMLDMTDALRPSELFAFRWKSFDDVNTLSITETIYRRKIRPFGKTPGSMTKVHLPDGLAGELRQWKLECPDPSPDAPMFPNADGGFLDPANFRYRVLKPLREAWELPKLNFQVLRRTIATRAQKLGFGEGRSITLASLTSRHHSERVHAGASGECAADGRNGLRDAHVDGNRAEGRVGLSR